MAEPQLLTPQEWDRAMLNGKNRMTHEQAMLYNLVQIRRSMSFFVVLASVWIALTVLGAILVLASN